MYKDFEGTTVNVLPRLGVRLDFLERFIKDKKIPVNWTTQQVVTEIIIKDTKTDERYTDVIDREYPEEAYVGLNASVFISHAWSRRFVELAESLTTGRLFGRSNRQKYVWLDIFTVHQHGGPLQQLDLHTITECIQTIKYTAVILDDGLDNERTGNITLSEVISKPVALSRIWCLSEIWNTIRFGGEVQFINTGVLFGGVGRCGWFDRRPFEVSCLNAEATKEEDLARILAEMEDAKAMCDELNCDSHRMKAFPFNRVFEILNTGKVNEQQKAISLKDTALTCSMCNCSKHENFKYYILFCEMSKKIVCRNCVIKDRKDTYITEVDNTINDGILEL